MPNVSDILPPPFEWINIPGGKATLVEAFYETGFIGKRGESKTFDVPSFAMGKYPVTHGQFQVFLDAQEGYNNSTWWDYSEDAKRWREIYPHPRETGSVGNDHPRTNVTWFEAVAFCLWLSEATGDNIMPPTDQQWQRAVIGDTNRMYPWGNDWDGSRCNTSVAPFNSKGTRPVTCYDGKGESPFGVVDMIGNVWEWCLTDYDNGSNNIEQKSTGRVLRGGSWAIHDVSYFHADQCHVSTPFSWSIEGGFRIARS